MGKKIILWTLASAAALTIGMAVYYVVILLVHRTLP